MRIIVIACLHMCSFGVCESIGVDVYLYVSMLVQYTYVY